MGAMTKEADRPGQGTDGHSTTSEQTRDKNSTPRADLAAKEYLDNRFSVVPVNPETKKPYIQWKSFQRRLPTEAEVEAWWTAKPNSGVAVITGALSGVVVVDLDLHKAPEAEHAAIRDAVRKRWGATPWVATTQHGGEHWWFRHPGTEVRNRTGIIPHVDLRGDGGYVVAPPTPGYTWRTRDGDLDELPIYHDSKDAAPAPPGNGLDALMTEERPELTKGEKEGGRNDAAARLAGQLIDEGKTAAETLVYLRGWNLSNEPPLGDTELRGVVESIASADRRNHPEKGAESARHPILTNMADVAAEEVDWLWNPYLPFGKVALLEGHPGYGKTWLALQLTAAITTGAALPGDVAADFGVATPREPANVLFMTAEDGLADTIRPRLNAAGADPSRVSVLEGWRDGQKQGEITLDDLPLLRQTLEEVHPALWIIDPLFAYLGADKDLHRANEVRPTMAGLKRLAEEYHCVVLGIRHLNKGGGGSAILRGLGSIDFAAAVRSILLVAEDPQDPARRIVAHSKASLARKGESLCFRLDDGTFRWDGTSQLTADDLVAPQGQRKDGYSARDEAEEFLREVLKDGPQEAAEVERQAKSATISPATLKRAKATLGVESLRPKKVGGPWTWAMPGEAAAEGIVAADSMKKWERAWWSGGAEVRDGAPYLSEVALKGKLREDGHGYVAGVTEPLLKEGVIEAADGGWILIDEETAADLITKRGDEAASPRVAHPLEDQMSHTDETKTPPSVRLNEPHGRINELRAIQTTPHVRTKGSPREAHMSHTRHGDDPHVKLNEPHANNNNLQCGHGGLGTVPSREAQVDPLGDEPHVGGTATTETAKNDLIGEDPPSPPKDLIGDATPPPAAEEFEL